MNRWVGIACLLLLVASAAESTDYPTHARGFSGPFQSAELDSVSLFTGALSMQVPLGGSYRGGGDLFYGFVLSYNSNIWDYETVFEATGFETEASVSPIFNAGAGWTLSIGRLLRPEHSSTGKWMYISPDGGSHRFYDTLHREEDDGTPSSNPADIWSYTRDGSYLRMTKLYGGNNWRQIEFPNGVKQVFFRTTDPDAAVQGEWLLDSMEDRHGNSLTVTYDYDDPNFEEIWELSDDIGRTHYIRLNNRGATSWNTIEEVDLEGPGGTRLVYTFDYVSDTHFARSCKDTSQSTGSMDYPRLGKLTMPDGSALQMEDAGGHWYHETCAGIDDLPGVVYKVKLPTGGFLEWDFQEYELPPGASQSVFNTSAGVEKRRMVAADGVTTVGEWTYRTSTAAPDNGDGPEPEVYTEVGYPTGECMKHYFSGWYYLDPNWGDDEVHRGWDLGLPFVWSQSSDGRYLSTELHPTTGNQDECTGSPLRSTYLSYTRDELPNSPGSADTWHNSNRRPTGRRTVFHDDGDRYIDVEFSDFDGMGHYRTTVTTTDVAGATSVTLTRTATTAFNPSFGTYCYDPDTNGPCATQDWSIADTSTQNWVLGTFTHRTIDEPGAYGQTHQRQEFLFNLDGQLEKTRTLSSNDGTLSADDVLTEHLYHSTGEIQSTRRYGGDVQPLSIGSTWTLPPTYQYRTDRTYVNGALSESQSFDSAGVPLPFLNYDASIDGSGAVQSRTTEAGFATTMVYDTAGRVKEIVPQAGAKTVYTYPNPNVFPWTVTIEQVDGAAVLTSQTVEYDAFGREVKVTRQTADHGAVDSVTAYNARGWVTSQSVTGLPGDVTTYEYDAFGRPTKVKPPDGTAHDVLTSYEGVRKVTRQVSRATSPGVESYVSTESYTDGFGRTERVLQPAAPVGGTLATVYDYDVGDRLTRISSTEPFPGVTQVREYEYDGRGFLNREKHPEKGAAGNGWVTYSHYDAGGNVGEVVDGGNHIKKVRDALARVIRVEDVNQSNRLLIEYEYDDGVGFGEGRVWKAIRHNYRDLPWISGETDVTVTETFTYNDPQGKVSHRDTDVAPVGLSFDTGFAYNALGQRSRIDYPSCASGGCAGLGRTHSVTYDFTEGQLTGIPGWATSISYHRNGLIDQIVRPNGVTDDVNRDASGLPRPKRMRTLGVQKNDNWNSGVYAYDGAGSISAIGQGDYVYDEVGRLTEATIGNHTRSYTYDSYGNLGSITTLYPDLTQETYSTATDATTNRLSIASYNSAGSVSFLINTSYAYDALDRLKERATAGSSAAHTYVYTAGGERIWEIEGDAVSTSERFSLRDLAGKVLRTWTLDRSGTESWAFERDYVYRDGQLLATEKPGSVVHHSHLDHLGSPRLVTDGSGFKVSEHTYFPYGAELTNPALSSERMRFTGHERDTPTSGGAGSLDYMRARYFNAHYGRFLRVDPLTGSPDSPQSLNRYAYVMGSPVNFVDPLGLQSEDTNEVLDALGEQLEPEEMALALAYYYGLIVDALGCGKKFDTDCADAAVDLLRWYIESGQKVGAPPPPEVIKEIIVKYEVVDKFEEEVEVEDEKGQFEDEVATEVGYYCNNFICFEVEATGKPWLVALQLWRIQYEIDVMWGLNDLMIGRCQMSPSLCALGGGGGNAALAGI